MTQGPKAYILRGLIFAVVVAGALSASAWYALHQVETALNDQLERRLKSYSAITAEGLDHEALGYIEDSDDEISKLYRKRLEVLEQTAGVRRAAVLTRDGSLVVDTKGSPPGETDIGFVVDRNELERSFDEGAVATIEYTDNDGRVFRNGFAPVPNANGEPAFAVAVELEADYSERLNAITWSLWAAVVAVFGVTLATAMWVARSTGRLQSDLERQRKLAEQAQFGAGMAHQIKNPLAALKGYVEILKRDLIEDRQRAIADKLIAEIGGLDRVVREFLRFSRGAEGDTETFQVSALLSSMAEEIRSDNVSVEIEGDTEVRTDRTALREALANIVFNARDAVGDSGTVRVNIALRGRLVAVEVTDDAGGIDSDVRAKLFEPFVTAKADGTGLGLPIARRLLRDLGGDLTLERSDNTGTTFRATFEKELA